MTRFRSLFVSFALVLVSALATHINAVSTDQHVVHHACEGETFCATKPENYPQEAIDRVLIHHMPHLHRMRRAVPELAPPRPEGNCAATKSEMITPFTLKHEDAVPKLIVQSKWFQQKVPQVTCKKVDKCFSSYTLDIVGVKTQCMTKKLVSTVVVFNSVDNHLEEVETQIDIDCACVIKHEDEKYED